MKKKLFIGGIFTLISVISVVVYLVFQGIFIPNQISVDKYEIKGVDVASYQGDIDWRELEKQNMKFAFIKATEGSSFVDEYFSKNWRNANKTDMRIGAYHFFSFDSKGETQAEQFIRTVPKYKQALPPVIDVEFYANKKNNPPKREDVTKELAVMIEMLEKHYDKKVILYATQEAYDLYIKDAYPKCDIWIRSVLTKPSLSDERKWTFWQYTNRGRLSGYNGKEKYIDLNVFYGNEEEFENYGMKG
ncbi:TPA: glycoside hydrolase family 25 protein [Bacillus cereus]|uniref:glycoside hydrolase family 25 protein n=1 Tax=Bacillus thuringiensis TaxID=1428 RepID=UPI000BF2A4C4|nr:GH25 family lysozyme [Bacillus thuringiensis]PFU70649.1 glycoside hydrolase family 25 [Bacillus thuringiensis]HDR8128135.1 glycoside hydrolase family 25 protein [Bacillus cereus]HDR8129440.1 glycoside hydrolase family 25 protein [Bacillus cereus]HDR8493030.1 glycoside hydrolase family 25 protein [Bacillus cereus]